MAKCFERYFFHHKQNKIFQKICVSKWKQYGRTKRRKDALFTYIV